MNSLFCALLLLLLLLDSWRLLATLRAITYVVFVLGPKSGPKLHLPIEGKKENHVFRR